MWHAFRACHTVSVLALHFDTRNNNMWAAITDYSKNKEQIYHAHVKQAGLLTAGIDIGLTSSKVVVMADGELFAYGIFWGDASNPGKARSLLDVTLNGTGMTGVDIQSLVATGRGANDVFQGKERTVSEIACHARGAFHCYDGSSNSMKPLGTVLVMGGLDCAAIHCNEKGLVKAFLTNACSPSHCRRSRCGGCGAAQGRAMDVIADVLAVPLEKVSKASLMISLEQLEQKLAQPLDERQDDVEGDGGPMPLGATLNDICVVLAKSQVMGLLRNHWSTEEVLAACCTGLAHNAALLLQRIGIQKEVSLTGGVAKNLGVVRRLEDELGITVFVPRPDPQITGAVGAALFARDLLLKSQKTGV